MIFFYLICVFNVFVNVNHYDAKPLLVMVRGGIQGGNAGELW